LAIKLYIGNLHYSVTQTQIRELFAGAGEIIDVYIAKDRYSSKSSGFGFVEMATEVESQKAIELYHGYSLVDRRMTVQEIKNAAKTEWKGSSGTVVYRKSPTPIVEGVEGDDVTATTAG